MRQPPPLASWLLDHWTAGIHRQALAGDLLEHVQLGRSDRWYWRQVFAAIVLSRAHQAASNWASILFAAIWSGITPAILLLAIQLLENERLMEHLRQLDSPWFTIAKQGMEIGAFFFILWLGLTLHALLHVGAGKGVDLHRVGRSLLLTIPIFLQMWMSVAAVTLIVASVFPQRVFGLDWPQSSMVSHLIGMAFSPPSLVSFGTMVLAILASLPRGIEDHPPRPVSAA